MRYLTLNCCADPGAAVLDNVDGSSLKPTVRIERCSRPSSFSTATNSTLSCDRRFLSINTTIPSEVNQLYLISYTAVDTKGNAATPVFRALTIQRRCPLPDFWCPSISTCSVAKICLSTSTSTAGSQTPQAAALAVSSVFIPVVDSTPPSLTLNGNGVRAITSKGVVVMIDDVGWGSPWIDPGATALDAVDGNLTGVVSAFGAGGVSTDRPTPASSSFSYVVQYSVEDRSGNAAPAAERRLRVVCPSGECLGTCFV
jgi:hypothetical protein